MKSTLSALTLFVALTGCNTPESSPSGIPVQTYTILDGQKIQVPTKNGFPMSVEDDFTRIEMAGMMLGPSKSNAKQPCIGWALGIRSKKGEKPISILVEDVTRPEIKMITSDDAPILNEKRIWNRFTDFLEPVSRETTPWLYESGASTKVFRFTVSYPSGARSVLFQPSVVNDLAKSVAAKMAENIRKS